MLRLVVPVEVAAEEGSSKKPRGRPPSVGHFHEDVSPTHFCKIHMAPGIGVLLELCPRGNNKDVIIIILVHDNIYIPC
jgi:hypothetical protein